MTTKATKKTRQVNLRLSASDRASLERAAELAGLSMSALMLEASLERAQQVVREHASLVVPSDLFDDLLTALDAPARELPDRLATAFQRLPDVVEAR